jgi:23S rRNA G2069 N7-methylase RlmK/C1962 C5-methylase RlmI
MAFEGLLRAWSDDRTLYRDADFALVDKPAGVACTERATVPGGAPSALPERLRAHGFGRFAVLSSVPERASGVVLVLFQRDGAPPDAKGLSDRLELTYVAGVDAWGLPPSGTLTSTPGRADQLEYRVERRRGPRVLVELKGRVAPERVLDLLRAHGQRVVGDEAVPSATRLMLHVRRSRGPVSGEAPLPVEFESWLAGQAELAPAHFARALASAGISRHGLAPALGAFRLLGEEAGEIAGVSVERYGDHAVLFSSSEEAVRRELEMAECLMDHGAAGVYVKRRVRADLRGVDAATLAPPLPVRGRPAPERVAIDAGLFRCFVCLADGLATGLFLDQRANWGRVLDGARAGSFLNLFCYTGAFTLAAAAGAAASTTSVDLAGRALSRLAENLELNGWSGSRHRLLKADVPAWLARTRRNQRRYDLVVLDPPSFGTRARGVLSTERDNAALVEGALGVLAPGGRLLSVSHHRKISSLELEQQLARACDSLGLAVRLEALVGGWDCPSLPGVTATKSVLAQLSS